MHGNEYKLLIKSICAEFTLVEYIRHKKRFEMKTQSSRGRRLGTEITDVAQESNILDYIS